MKPVTLRASPSQLRTIAANIRRAEQLVLAQVDDGRFSHDRITAANDALFTEAFFSEPLTAFAVGYRDPEDLDACIEFYAPRVEVPRRFEYAEFANAEEFLSETTDDLRAPGADFKTVEYTSTKKNEKTDNRGLRICVDLDQVGDLSRWREDKVAKLLRRIKRNKLRRALALLSAAAVNTGKAWTPEAGSDPDQDCITELINARTASGISPNRIGFGDTAWSKRLLAHRAQNNAGGYASAGLAADQVAAFLGVDQVHVCKARYQTGAAAKAEIVGNLVLLFNALTGADTEDASNIKGFWTPCEGGAQFRVYERQLSAKLYEIIVEHYEKLKITSTLGIRKLTIA